MRKLTAVAFIACLVFPCSLYAACTFGFLSEVTTNAGSKPGDVTSGDFNKDGLADLAIVNRQSDKIAILLGQQGGTFAAPAYTSTGGAFNQYDIAAAYIDGDQNLDLLVMGGKSVYNDTTFSEMNVQVLTGNGAGGFSLGDYEWIGTNGYDIAAGDFDNDGDTDFAVTRNGGNPPGFHLIINLGGGNIAQKSDNRIADDMVTSGWLSAVAAADFDGDGKLDVAASDSVNRKVWIWFGVGDGTFTRSTAPVITTADVDHGAGAMVAADFNGDGYADLAFANEVTASWHEGMLTPDFGIALSNGASRTFATPVVLDTVSGAQKALTADVNGDGKADVVLSLTSSVRVYLGGGDGTFTHQDFGTGGTGLAILDVDRDGGLDVAATHFGANNVGILQNACGQVTLDLVSSANPASYGSSFTVTAAITSTPAATGTLTLSRTGGPTLGTTNLSASSSVSSTQALDLGMYEFVATYSGDSRFPTTTKKLLQTVQTAPFGPPPGLQAVFIPAEGGNGHVRVTWYPTSGTAKYQVWRKPAGVDVWSLAGETASGAETTLNDLAPPYGTAILYLVRAVATGTPIISGDSNADFTTTYTFTDESIASSGTPVKSAHLSEARAAANALRGLAGLGPAPWTSSPLILAAQITELRAAVNEARIALGGAATSFTDAIAPGVLIKRVHMTELRSAMR